MCGLGVCTCMYVHICTWVEARHRQDQMPANTTLVIKFSTMAELRRTFFNISAHTPDLRASPSRAETNHCHVYVNSSIPTTRTSPYPTMFFSYARMYVSRH